MLYCRESGYGTYDACRRRRCSSTGETAMVAHELWRKLSQDREHLGFLAIDARLCVIGWRRVFSGDVDAVMFHPRVWWRDVLSVPRCNGIVAVHNHPAGNPEPSTNDVKLTKVMQQQGELFGVPVLDHIVLGSEDSYRSVLMMSEV